jgi:deoxyadenosine/deoxycytidine kinase
LKLNDNFFDKKHVVVYEPVDQWMKKQKQKNEKGEETKSMLELYYENPEKNAFAFQMYTLQTRQEVINKAIQDNPGKIIISERCPDSDCNIFTKMLHETGKINDIELKVYNHWYDFSSHLVKPCVCCVLYLNESVKTCKSRIIKRNRDGEHDISLEYLEELHKMHTKWLQNIPKDKILEFKYDDKGNVDFEMLTKFINEKIK